MSGLSLVAHNVHDVAIDGRRVLFHIPTTSLFEMDDVSGAVLDLFKSRAAVTREVLRTQFKGRYQRAELEETIDGFLELDIVRDVRAQDQAVRPVKVENFPLSTMILTVNTGCNLACNYCYKEDLTSPDKGQKMEFETAVKAFELLLERARDRARVNLVFFGGEPLTNLPLIKQMVDYAERRGAEVGKTVDFSLTTNATLLREEIVDYLDAHRFGITVSMDGPKALHDKYRKTVGGKGSYDAVAKNARMLLSRYRSRPVGVRVTLTRGVTDVIGIHDHLKNDIGFFEVGFSPVSSGDIAQFNLDADELAQVFHDMKVLGETYTEAALRDENIGFSNMHQLMNDLVEGTKKALPCGAGLGMLAADKDGGLNLCHRFTGSKLPTFGSVDDGIDEPALADFLEQAQDKSEKGCATCRIRNICAGGCYHESYARFEDPHSPVYHYCELMRDWVDFGISAYGRIMAGNPGFLKRHVEPRRTRYETP
ncbi:MAG: quinohemoprotein amine dehydrogenase maturation protein [Alphaproteobacteria bacterium]|nr:quinohemoprotein amine dehydrogenase maturation protein [Alphaproteobacteria bacterium]